MGIGASVPQKWHKTIIALSDTVSEGHFVTHAYLQAHAWERVWQSYIDLLSLIHKTPGLEVITVRSRRVSHLSKTPSLEALSVESPIFQLLDCAGASALAVGWSDMFCAPFHFLWAGVIMALDAKPSTSRYRRKLALRVARAAASLAQRRRRRKPRGLHGPWSSKLRQPRSSWTSRNSWTTSASASLAARGLSSRLVPAHLLIWGPSAAGCCSAWKRAPRNKQLTVEREWPRQGVGALLGLDAGQGRVQDHLVVGQPRRDCGWMSEGVAKQQKVGVGEWTN